MVLLACQRRRLRKSARGGYQTVILFLRFVKMPLWCARHTKDLAAKFKERCIPKWCETRSLHALTAWSVSAMMLRQPTLRAPKQSFPYGQVITVDA
jgi:hypothetical protein